MVRVAYVYFLLFLGLQSFGYVTNDRNGKSDLTTGETTTQWRGIPTSIRPLYVYLSLFFSVSNKNKKTNTHKSSLGKTSGFFKFSVMNETRMQSMNRKTKNKKKQEKTKQPWTVVTGIRIWPCRPTILEIRSAAKQPVTIRCALRQFWSSNTFFPFSPTRVTSILRPVTLFLLLFYFVDKLSIENQTKNLNKTIHQTYEARLSGLLWPAVHGPQPSDGTCVAT